MTTTQPLAESTTADWDAAHTRIAEGTSNAAYELTELTAQLDVDLNHLVLDPETRTVWWAYDNTPFDGEGWTVQQLAPSTATDQLGDIVEVILDRQDDLTEYAERHADLDRDQDALDEYAAVLLLALAAEPAAAVAQIKRQRSLIARQDALQQRAYATLVAELAGTERGGKTRAGRALSITDVQIGRIIREDQNRRAALADAVQAARRDRAEHTAPPQSARLQHWNADHHLTTTHRGLPDNDTQGEPGTPPRQPVNDHRTGISAWP